MNTIAASVLCAIMVAIAVSVTPLGAAAESTAPQGPLSERSLGAADAAVTIIEYSSLTCPHCATFHKEVLPELKRAYIDTGKVRLIYRDYPLDGRATAAAMIARCVDPARYFAFVDILYRDQQTWARSADPLSELKARARVAGLGDADVDACLKNRELLESIQARARKASETYGINSTPSFLVNDRRVEGPPTVETFRPLIEGALKQTDRRGGWLGRPDANALAQRVR
jgi:protein-disulfide isomerase